MTHCFLGLLKRTNGDIEYTEKYLVQHNACFKTSPKKFLCYLIFDGLLRIQFNVLFGYKLYLLFCGDYMRAYSIIFGIFSLGWYFASLMIGIFIAPIMTMNGMIISDSITQRKKDNGPKCC